MFAFNANQAGPTSTNPQQDMNDAPQYEGTLVEEAVCLPETLATDVLPGMDVQPMAISSVRDSFPKADFVGGHRFHSRVVTPDEPSSGTLLTVTSHKVVHFFDRCTLMRELRAAGFNVTYNTYTTAQGEPFVPSAAITSAASAGISPHNTEPSDDEFESLVIGIHFEAVKPKVS